MIIYLPEVSVGWGSSVGIANHYRMNGPGIESHWGARFSAPVQNGPGAHPTSCTMNIVSLYRRQSGLGVALTTYPHVAQRIELFYVELFTFT